MNIKPVLNKRPYVYAFCTGFTLFPLNTNRVVDKDSISIEPVQEQNYDNKGDSAVSTFRNYFEASQNLKK